jgi:hypothetical protein
VDTDKLNRLLRQRPRDMDRVHKALRELASVAAATVRCPRTFREDLVGELHVFLVEKVLPRYRPQTDSAMTYFSRAALRQSWVIVERLGRDRRRMGPLPDPSAEGDGISDDRRGKRPKMIAQAKRNWSKLGPVARIDQQLRALQDESRGNDDEDELDAIRWMAAALQELRHHLTGQYRLLKLPGIRYFKQRRIPREK